MAKLLFKLNNVPDEEADEIRSLLDTESIDFYETTPGLLGLSFAAIWLKSEAQFDHASSLIEGYQIRRYEQAKENYQNLKAEGLHPTLLQAFKQRPFIFLAVILFVLSVLYLTVSPFFADLTGLT